MAGGTNGSHNLGAGFVQERTQHGFSYAFELGSDDAVLRHRPARSRMRRQRESTADNLTATAGVVDCTSEARSRLVPIFPVEAIGEPTYGLSAAAVDSPTMPTVRHPRFDACERVQPFVSSHLRFWQS